MGTVKKYFGKGAVFALAAVLSCLMLAGLSACGEAPEETIRKGVTTELESIKNLDQSAIDEIMAGAGSAGTELEAYGIDMEEFCRTWLSGFDYTVDDVKVDGSNADATVTITCRSLMEGVSIWSDKVTEASQDPEILNLSSDELNKKLGSLLTESIAEAPLESNVVTLSYVLNGNTWEPGPDFDAALSKAFAGGAL